MTYSVQLLSSDEIVNITPYIGANGLLYSPYVEYIASHLPSPVMIPGGIDIYNPNWYIDLYTQNFPESFIPDTAEFPKWVNQYGKVNTGLYSYRYFPKKDKYTLSFGENRDYGYLLIDERICGITGCDGTFYIETGLSSGKQTSMLPYNITIYGETYDTDSPLRFSVLHIPIVNTDYDAVYFYDKNIPKRIQDVYSKYIPNLGYNILQNQNTYMDQTVLPEYYAYGEGGNSYSSNL